MGVYTWTNFGQSKSNFRFFMFCLYEFLSVIWFTYLFAHLVSCKMYVNIRIKALGMVSQGIFESNWEKPDSNISLLHFFLSIIIISGLHQSFQSERNVIRIELSQPLFNLTEPSIHLPTDNSVALKRSLCETLNVNEC